MTTTPTIRHAGEVCLIDIAIVGGDCKAVHNEWVEQLYAEFGRTVRIKREKLDLSQAEVATRMGRTRASISNLEAGRQRPVLHQIYQLAQILNVDVIDLLPEHLVDPDRQRHEQLRERLLSVAANQ